MSHDGSLPIPYTSEWRTYPCPHTGRRYAKWTTLGMSIEIDCSLDTLHIHINTAIGGTRLAIPTPILRAIDPRFPSRLEP